MLVSSLSDNKVFARTDDPANEGLAFPLPLSAEPRPRIRHPNTLFLLQKNVNSENADTRHSSTFTSGNLRLVSAISGVTGLAGSSRITCLLTRGILAQCSFLKQKKTTHTHTHV